MNNNSQNNRPKNPSYNNNHNRSPNHHTPQRTLAQMMKSWHDLHTVYMRARHLYYINFDFVEPKRVKQLEKEFFKSMENLRTFEAKMNDTEKNYFKNRIQEYKLDRDYSLQLPVDNTNAPETEIKNSGENPHFPPNLQEIYSTYKKDTEISVGSMADYQQYKSATKINRTIQQS